ncbi:MAG: DEAD/DEAH box helicase [Cyclobacteriaceae bacterium]|nr:DEAD/DEAH box helicase [Cyclobacteriaceae bacterium]
MITLLERDTEFESKYYYLLKSLHHKFAKQFPDEFFYLDINELMHDQWFFSAFERLDKDGVEVLGFNELKNFKFSTQRARITSQISSGQDWFDVNVVVSFGKEKVSLADVRKSVLRNDKYIRLSDGSLGILPEEWLPKFSRIFRQGELKNEKITISSRKFMIIDELLEDIDDLGLIKELNAKKRKLEEFTELKSTKVPRQIKAELRSYQKEGLNWLNFLDEFGWGGILADDMGLGKTLQILTFLAQKKTKNASLIVVPTTLMFNWENEIAKFCPSLKVHFHYGQNRNKDHEGFDDVHLVITTYGLVINDIEWLKAYPFHYVILDESQAIKNPQSLRFKAVGLLQAKTRITMTGTPIENNTFDLYAQMHFANPGLLGNAKAFKDNFSTPIDKDGDKERAEELRKMIKPFMIRRTKEQVATELPPKTEEILYCHMEKAQQSVYDAFKHKYRDLLLGKIDEDGLEKSKIYVLEGLMKLRQICDSPKLLPGDEEYGSESVKIVELLRNIEEKTGNHKIVVFSQFVGMLALIKAELDKDKVNYEYLDGKSSPKQRRDSVDRFQSTENCRVFLISLKAGGTGLNLTAADYVFIVDPWWNPAVESQAIDRCYRIGQDKKVFAYRMICKGTIEEKIVSYQHKKKAVADDIIQAEESFVKKLVT